MNPTIEILLKRMESNPDEFTKENRWHYLFENFADNLDEEDKEAYKKGLNKIRLNQFHARVMEELLDPKSESVEIQSYLKQQTATQQAGQTHAQHMAMQKAYLAQQQAQLAQAQNQYQQASLGGLSSLGNLFGGQSK